MIRTKLLKEVEIGPDDRDVLRAFLGAAQPADGQTSTPILVGVTNSSEKVYRILKLYGLGEWTRLVRLMALLGYEPESGLGASAGSGLHEVFRKRR